LDMSKYILWYYKAFLTSQIGAGFAVLAPTITTATPGSAGTLADGTYYYQVTAINGTEGSPSNEVVVTVSAGGTGSAVLVWEAVAGATGYRVYRGTSAGGESVYYAPGAVTTYTDTGAASTAGTPPVLGAWVLIGSSDATTAGMDGLDRWTSVYTAGKINRNTAGSAHSWVVLRGPVMATKTYYILIDWSTSVDYAVTVSLGHTTAPLGGTINNAPTVQNPAPLTTSNFGAYVNNTPNVASFRVHGSLAADGSFVILTSLDYTSKFLSGFMCHLLSSYKATDPYPVYMSLTGEIVAQTPGTGYGGQLAAVVVGWDHSNNGIARTPDNLGAGAYGVITPALSNIPNVADAFDGTYVDWPVYVGNKVAGNITARGRIQDIYYSPYALGANTPSQGAVDNATSPEYMVVGVWWFPTNAIPLIY
jgi:hypothetical protein